MAPNESDLTIDNLIKKYMNIAVQDKVISNLGNNYTSNSIFSENSHQFELGHTNWNAKPHSGKFKSGFDEEDNFYKRYYDLDGKEWKKNLWEIHPGNIPLSELIETMKPVSVSGLDDPKTKGIYGSIEGVDFNIGADVHLDGEHVPENALVWVHYALFLEGENLPFDSSVKRRRGKPEVLIASSEALIPSMAVAVRWLRVGQRGRFIFPPSAYGELGLLGTVPPDTSVLLLLHVMRSTDAGALQRYDLLDECDKNDFEKVHYYIKCANELARDFFYRKKTSECIEVYKKCIEMLCDCKRDQSNHHILEDLLLKTYVNLALSITRDRRGNVLQALDYLECASRFKKFDTNCKAHFILGKCHMTLMNYEEAQKSLLTAFKLEPNNVEIGSELEKLDDILKQSKSIQKDIAKKYINNENALDNKDIKTRECLLSREDVSRVVQCVDKLDKVHGMVSYETWRLLPEEVEIVKSLSSRRLDANTLYSLK